MNSMNNSCLIVCAVYDHTMPFVIMNSYISIFVNSQILSSQSQNNATHKIILDRFVTLRAFCFASSTLLKCVAQINVTLITYNAAKTHFSLQTKQTSLFMGLLTHQLHNIFADDGKKSTPTVLSAVTGSMNCRRRL